MRQSINRSNQGGWVRLDRIAVAWMIQIAVILWIAFGAAGQISRQCRREGGDIECRTISGNINVDVPFLSR